MRKWEDMLNKTELWTSYNIVFPTTDKGIICQGIICLLYTSPSPRD